MQILASNFIVRRSYYRRSKALDEFCSMARSMGVHYTKLSSKVAKNTNFSDLFTAHSAFRSKLGPKVPNRVGID